MTLTNHISDWLLEAPRFGGWVVSGHEQSLEAYAIAGFDYVGIDCQHSIIDEAAAAQLIRRRPEPSVPIIARASTNAAAPIGRLLDAGADLIIVPGVNNEAEAEAAVAACRYPPLGVRSYGPIRRNLGATPEDIAQRALCFVMIETSEGLKNASEICSVEGLSGVYVGPADLSLGLGLPVGKAFTTDQLEAPFQTIASACDHAGILLGAHASTAENARRWVKWGCSLVSIGSDTNLMQSACNQLRMELAQMSPDSLMDSHQASAYEAPADSPYA